MDKKLQEFLTGETNEVIQHHNDGRVNLAVVYPQDLETKERNKILLNVAGVSEAMIETIAGLPPEAVEKIEKMARIKSLKAEIKKLEQEIRGK